MGIPAKYCAKCGMAWIGHGDIHLGCEADRPIPKDHVRTPVDNPRGYKDGEVIFDCVLGPGFKVTAVY